MLPLVTVYIPTHNRKHLVTRAINSVLKQSHKPIEIIVVDDGSSDDTESHLSPFIKANQIRFFKNTTPKGACHARNRAIFEATGEFITGLDDDDEFTSNRVSSFVQAYNCQSAFLFSSYQIQQIDNSKLWSSGPSQPNHSNLLKRNTVGNQVFVERQRLLSIGGFDESLPAWQDHDVWIRLTKKYGKAKRVDLPSYIIDTSHPHETISKNLENIFKAYQIFQNKYPEYQTAAFRRFLRLNYLQYPGVPFPFLEFLSILPSSAGKRAIKVFLDKLS